MTRDSEEAAAAEEAIRRAYAEEDARAAAAKKDRLAAEERKARLAAEEAEEAAFQAEKEKLEAISQLRSWRADRRASKRGRRDEREWARKRSRECPHRRIIIKMR